jgi:CheY-like chemotaxis protein
MLAKIGALDEPLAVATALGGDVNGLRGQVTRLERGLAELTTKQEGRGTGLGLSMVFGFIRQSGGHITVDSVLDRGTIFRLHLPRCEGGEEVEFEVAQPPSEAVGGRETILLVEDNEAVRSITTDILIQFGYEVIATANAYHALTILLGEQKVDLLLSDVVMPGGLDGFALIRHASQLRPGLPVLLASGFVEPSEPIPGVRVLSKPYRQADLARAVRETLDEKGDVPA